MSIRGTLDRRRRKALSHVAKRLYRDTAGGPEHAVLVSGMARSGTTWLAEVLSADLHARLLFEPFDRRYVPAFSIFEYLQYMPSHADDPVLEGFVSEVLNGRLRDPDWIDRMVSVLRPRARVVKAVRACLMLRWIHDRFPETPTILIVRHPCAVASSFAKLEWSAQLDLESIRRQQDLMEDHLQDVAGILQSPLSPHQEVAVVWCVNHRVALSQCADSRISSLYYEDLIRHPEREIPRIFQTIGRPYSDSVYERLRRPSRTTTTGPEMGEVEGGEPGWRRDMAPSHVADIEEIVAAFELDHLYDERGHPTGRLRERD